MKRISLCVGMFGIAVSMAQPAGSAELMSVKELKEFYSGRVVETLTRRSGQPFTIKYQPDGILEGEISARNVHQDTGKWWVPSVGKLCVQWQKWGGGSELCSVLKFDNEYVYRTDPRGRETKFKRKK